MSNYSEFPNSSISEFDNRKPAMSNKREWLWRACGLGWNGVDGHDSMRAFLRGDKGYIIDGYGEWQLVFWRLWRKVK